MSTHRTGTREEWRRARLELMELYHVYAAYARGTDVFNAFYQLPDRAPKGRNEDNIPPGQWWWRRHDEYEHG
jgi:predicted dithiol-disulfide oxidoreductase (DUF899 family)